MRYYLLICKWIKWILDTVHQQEFSVLNLNAYFNSTSMNYPRSRLSNHLQSSQVSYGHCYICATCTHVASGMNRYRYVHFCKFAYNTIFCDQLLFIEIRTNFSSYQCIGMWVWHLYHRLHKLTMDITQPEILNG